MHISQIFLFRLPLAVLLLDHKDKIKSKFDVDIIGYNIGYNTQIIIAGGVGKNVPQVSENIYSALRSVLTY